MNLGDRQTLLDAELAAAETRKDVMRILEDLTAAHGFRHVAILAVPGAQEQYLQPLLMETTLPATFVRDFDRGEHLRNFSVLLNLRGSILPQSWHVPACDSEGRSAVALETVLLMRKYALHAGICVPMASIDGTRYAMLFAGTRGALANAEINGITLFSMRIFDAYDRVRRKENALPNPLSARELEVLRWTAQGKTSVEIGHILTLSDHTVNAYLTNAIKKLDCVNRTQLVAKALRLKLIA